MAFLLERLTRGNKVNPNGRFEVYEKAREAMQHGVRWHQANGTSSKFRIILDDATRQDVTAGYVDNSDDDFDDLPPPEESPEQRIKQLEDQLAKMQKLLEKRDEPEEEKAIEEPAVEPVEEEASRGKRRREKEPATGGREVF